MSHSRVESKTAVKNSIGRLAFCALAILLEVVLLPLAHNWGFWYNTLDGLIYGTFILAAKVMWHLIDFGQSFYMAAALNEQIRKRKREEIQKEGTNNG